MIDRVQGKFAVGVARLTKPAGFGVLAAFLMAMSPTASLAQAAAPLTPSASAALDVRRPKSLQMAASRRKRRRTLGNRS